MFLPQQRRALVDVPGLVDRVSQRAHHAAAGHDQQQDRERADAAGPAQRVADGRLEPRAVVAGRERDVLEHGPHDSAADVGVVEEQPERGDEQQRQRDERQHHEEPHLGGVAMDAVVDALEQRAPRRQRDPIADRAGALLLAHAAVQRLGAVAAR